MKLLPSLKAPQIFLGDVSVIDQAEFTQTPQNQNHTSHAFLHVGEEKL